MRGTKMLVGLHRPYPGKTNMLWTTPGGKCTKEEAETPDGVWEAAKRETEEETGITSLENVRYWGDGSPIPSKYSLHVFLATTPEEPQLKEPEKFVEWCWTEIGEIVDFINPPLLEILRRQLKTVT